MPKPNPCPAPVTSAALPFSRMRLSFAPLRASPRSLRSAAADHYIDREPARRSPAMNWTIHAHRNRRQARFQGRPHSPQAIDAQHPQRRRRRPRLPLPPHRLGMEGLSAHRRQHGRDRHHGDGACARQAWGAHRPAQALPGGEARRVLRRAGWRARLLFARHDRSRRQEARRGREGGADPVHLPRRRQRLCGEIPRDRQARARRLPARRHHGRQCRHRRHDGGADPGRRGHRQDRHRPRLGLHHAAGDRRRLSAALGDHRMRRRGARAERSGLRRRRLHRARATSPRPTARAPISSCWAACSPATTNATAKSAIEERGGEKIAGRHDVLRHVVGDRDEEALRRRRPLSRRRGQDGRDALSRTGRRARWARSWAACAR